MIGSKTKRAVLFRHLREDPAVDEGFLAAVRSPVVLCIGARSHEEIAVAVVGELIAVRRTGQDAAAAWRARRRPAAASGTAAGVRREEPSGDAADVAPAGEAAPRA